MRRDKSETVKLRTTGKSYNEIRKLLGVPKATLSDWFRNQKWSRKLTRKLNQKFLEQNKIRLARLDKIRGENLRKLYEEARREAEKEFHLLKHHPLFIAGVSIYWGEGDKATKSGFRISNVDPAMINLFRRFLIDICRVEETRIRVSLLLYPDLNDQNCKKYWVENAGLSENCFTKSVVIRGRSKNKRVAYGVCGISYSSRFLKEKMLIWIRLLGHEYHQ